MSGLLMRKIARDLWLARTRVVMMLLAITMSVIAVTGFLSSRAVIGREMARNYMATRPASATLHVPGGVDATAAAAVRGTGGVLDASPRAVRQARVRVGDGPWQILVLFAAETDDPQTVATVAPQTGSWPPPASGLMLERTAIDFLHVAVGETVTVQVPGGPPTPMHVTGSAHDGGVAPAQQEQTAYGYVTTAALARLGVPATLDQLRIVVGDEHGPSGDPAVVKRAAQAIADQLTAQGRAVTSIDIPPPLRHPHQGQMEMVGFVLLVFGLSALVLSGVLVATMLGGMVAAQTRQIGAMKAVGARTKDILAMYATQVAAIAVAATAAALAPGLALGRVLAGQAAGLLNLDLADQNPPGWVYATVLTAGVGVPLLIALVPLARASRITVREAIDGHTADPAKVGRRGVWLRGLSRTQSMGIRNAFRRRGRLTLTAGLLAVAGAMFLTGLNTAAGWTALVDQGVANRSYDLEVHFAQSYNAADLTTLARSVDGVTAAEAWGRTPTAVHQPGRIDIARVYPDESHASFTALAPPADTSLIRLPLLAGRWLRPDDTDKVVLNNLVPAQQAPGIRVGDSITLTIAGHTVRRQVVGIVSDFGTLGTAYLTNTDYAAITNRPGQAQMLRVVTDRHDPAGRQAILQRLDDTLAAAGIAVEQTTTIDTLRSALDGHVLVLADALIALAVVMGFVGLLGLASAASTSVAERTREFAVLHAIGATGPAVRGIVRAESLTTGVLGLLAALLVALPLTRVFGDFIGQQAFRQDLPYTFAAAALLLWTVLSLTGAALASTAAARRASRLTVREALTTT